MLMQLTFFYKGKKPGDQIEVPDSEVPQWRGFAKPVPATEQPAAAGKPTMTKTAKG